MIEVITGIRDVHGVSASKIRDHHWQSGFPRPFRDLRRHGIDLVVLAAKEAQPDPETLAWIRAHCPGLSLIVCGYEDTEDPAALPAIVKTASGVARRVAQRIAQGKNVLVTCAAGYNRSGLISALVLMEQFPISGRDAVE